MKASIDLLVDKLERQVKRYRQKRRHEHDATSATNGQRHGGPSPAARRGGDP